MALASATRRRWPPDSRTPPSPTWVSSSHSAEELRPPGHLTQFWSIGGESSPPNPPGAAPKARLSAMDPSSIHGSWGTRASWRRSDPAPGRAGRPRPARSPRRRGRRTVAAGRAGSTCRRRSADHADPLAGGDLQVEVAQDRGALGVGEPDPAQGQPAPGRAGPDRVGRRGHDLGRVEHLEDPLAAGRALGQGPGQPGQGPDGAVEAGQVGEHHQQRPQGHAPTADRGHPQPQDQAPPAPAAGRPPATSGPPGPWRPGGPDGAAAAAGEAGPGLLLAGEGLHPPGRCAAPRWPRRPGRRRRPWTAAGRRGCGAGAGRPPPPGAGATARAASPRVRSTASTTTTIPARVSTSGTSTVNQATIESSTRATSPVSG
jgi:hypothetical protein